MALGPRLAVGLSLAALLGSAVHDPGHAAASEIEVHARTVGQGYALRSFRLPGPDLSLDRRRFTQILSLGIYDIGDLRGPRRGRSLHEPYPASKPHIYFTGYLRMDHDFGDWAMGSIDLDRPFDAVDLIPELEHDLVSLDVLYAYMAAENLAGGRLSLYAGRQIDVDTLDWWSMDGITARLDTRLGVAVEASGGVRVRDASPAGSAAWEPDGTGGAACAEYVEGAVPGSGAWRPIDRPTPMQGNLFANDYDVCPQREQAMPTFGVAVETVDLGPVWARLGYRRSMSPTPGLIGPADRFEYPDTGLYPDEVDQAPGWGVNEERVAATVRANIDVAGTQITPHAAGRYDLLLGAVDEAHAGVRVQRGMHAVEPELYYSLPSFDGDSIFNVFATEPYLDLRCTYDLRPRRGRVHAFARAWARRFLAGEGTDGGAADQGATAGGVQLGTGYRPDARLQARLDLFHDAGYGGGRSGGAGAAFWQMSRRTGVRGRVGVVRFDDARPEGPRGTTVSVQAGTSYRVNHGVMVHVMAEETIDRSNHDQLRVIGVLDLAFVPEL